MSALLGVPDILESCHQVLRDRMRLLADMGVGIYLCNARRLMTVNDYMNDCIPSQDHILRLKERDARQCE